MTRPSLSDSEGLGITSAFLKKVLVDKERKREKEVAYCGSGRAALEREGRG